VAGNDQRHGIPGHGLTNIARSRRACTDLLRQDAVRSRVTPTDAACGYIDFLEERILLTEIEMEARKIDLLAIEISLRSHDGLGYLRRGSPGLRTGQTTQQIPLRRFRSLRGQLESLYTNAIPPDPAKATRGFENQILVRRLAHGTVTGF
jgi:hypothetical protein